MKMNVKFFSIVLCTLFVYTLAEYEHSYGNGHGGGHGFYGYPVGRKWGYSTYIKHPPPKHYSHGGHGYSGHNQNYGGYGHQHRGPGYGFGGPEFFPKFLSGFGNEYGGGGYPPYSHTYRQQYAPSVPYGEYGFGRNRRHEEYGGGHGLGFRPNGYNNYGHHKNHNYGGDSYGAHSTPGKAHNTGYMGPKTEFEGFEGLDDFFTKDFPNHFLDLNLPDNFQQLIY